MIRVATFLMTLAPFFAPQPAAVVTPGAGAVSVEPPLDYYESEARYDGSRYEIENDFRDGDERNRRREDDIKPTPRTDRPEKDGRREEKTKVFDGERMSLPRPRKEPDARNDLRQDASELLCVANNGGKVTFRFGEFSMIFPAQNEDVK